MNNKDLIRDQLQDYIDDLESVKQLLATDQQKQLFNFFACAKQARKSLER